MEIYHAGNPIAGGELRVFHPQVTPRKVRKGELLLEIVMDGRVSDSLIYLSSKDLKAISDSYPVYGIQEQGRLPSK